MLMGKGGGSGVTRIPMPQDGSIRMVLTIPNAKKKLKK